MSNVAEMLISKVIENGDVQAFTRFGVERHDFHTSSLVKTYDFLVDYAHANHNQTPSLPAVLDECDFTYIPNVTDSYEHLVREMKSYTVKNKIAQLLENKASQKFDEVNGFEFVEWLIEESQKVKQQSEIVTKIGTNIKTDTERYLSEYRRRKAGKSFKIWQSSFPSVNSTVGGYSSGNMFAMFGRSGRGKSVFALEEAINAAQQGAKVLYYALEMPSYEIMTRIFSSLSARKGLLRLNVGIEEIDAGFEQRKLLQGKLEDEFETAFEDFLKNINDHIEGEIIVRAIDDENMQVVDVKAIERDILTLKPDFVVIDPIYLMDYEQNTSRVAGGDVAETSKKLRRLCGRHNIVLLVITQAEEDKTQQRDEETQKRTLKIPNRSEMKKSKQILEDSAIVIALDSGDGRAILEVQKARAGGETQFDVLFIPSYGVVRELTPSEVSASKFEEVF